MERVVILSSTGTRKTDFFQWHTDSGMEAYRGNMSCRSGVLYAHGMAHGGPGRQEEIYL